MGYVTPILITALFFGVYGCGSTPKKPDDTQPMAQIDIQQADTDSVPQTPPPPKPSPAPETLQLEGKITGVHQSKQDSSYSYDFKVTRIVQVGAAAPAVILKDTIQIKASNQANTIKANTHLQCIITPRKVFGEEPSATESWQLVQWKYHRNHQ